MRKPFPLQGISKSRKCALLFDYPTCSCACVCVCTKMAAHTLLTHTHIHTGAIEIDFDFNNSSRKCLKIQIEARRIVAQAKRKCFPI